MIADEMTDEQVRDQVERADRFTAKFRELVAAAIPTSEAQRLGSIGSRRRSIRCRS